MKYPVTQGVRFLKKEKITFDPFLYNYEEKGGTKASSQALSIDEIFVIKTIILKDENRNLYLVLMHGNKEVSTKKMARIVRVKSLEPCDQKLAQNKTGYLFGGTSPFGLKTDIPIYMEKTILDLEFIWINGGKRGFLVKVSPKDIMAKLKAHLVEVAV